MRLRGLCRPRISTQPEGKKDGSRERSEPWSEGEGCGGFAVRAYLRSPSGKREGAPKQEGCNGQLSAATIEPTQARVV